MNAETAARFGDNLARLRRRAGLSQGDLGDRMAVDRTRISQLERGLKLARIDTLARLSTALEMSADELLEGITWQPGEPRRGQFREGGR